MQTHVEAAKGTVSCLYNAFQIVIMTLKKSSWEFAGKQTISSDIASNENCSPQCSLNYKPQQQQERHQCFICSKHLKHICIENDKNCNNLGNRPNRKTAVTVT